MGYGSYVLTDGTQGGYNVEAECDHDGCTTRIDRGLAYLCGTTPYDDGDHCGRWFCDAHRTVDLDAEHGDICDSCAARRADDTGTAP